VIRAGFLVATGVAAYFLILVFTLPAVQLEGYLEERVPGLSLSAVSGSVFKLPGNRPGFSALGIFTPGPVDRAG